MQGRKLKIAYYCSNRTVFPPPSGIVAANATVMRDIAAGMAAKGHQVTIYASQGSNFPGAEIVDLDLAAHTLDSAYEKSEWVADLHAAYRMTYVSELVARSAEYDLIHFHVGRAIYGLPFLRYAHCPVVFTLHENLVKEMEPVMRRYPKAFFVSISDAQRKTLPDLPYVATIHNGIRTEDFSFQEKSGDRCLFLSRVSPEKGVEFAIRATCQAGVGLDIFGPGEREYLNRAVRPHLGADIRYHGLAARLSDTWREAYSQAKVFLFPIQWEEPFGLAMIEALAAGTPVVTFGRGSTAEIIKDGETGFIVPPDDVAAMAAAIRKIYALPEVDYRQMRQACRQHAAQNFSVEKMVDEYEKVYWEILGRD